MFGRAAITLGIGPDFSLLLGRIAVLRTYAVYCYSPSSAVCRSVGRSDAVVSPAKTAESIEMPFAMWIRVGSRNRWRGGATGIALDLRSIRRGFESYSRQRCVITLFAPMWLCHQAV